MALSSYSDLLTSIASFAWRTGDTEFETAIPTFIGLAEERFNRELRVRWMEASDTITITDGVGVLPSDYLEFRRVKGAHCDLEVADGAWADRREEGPYFTISGANIRVFDKAATVDLDYYQTVPALTVSNQSNWLLTRYPSLYLYGALIEAAPFMADDQRMGVWGAMFDKAMSGLVTEDNGAKFARAKTRVRGATP